MPDSTSETRHLSSFSHPVSRLPANFDSLPTEHHSMQELVPTWNDLICAAGLKNVMQTITTGLSPFYFYAYYRNPKVTLHRGNCGFCQNGKGMQSNKLGNSTGRWRGSYSSFEQALEAAQFVGEGLGVVPEYCQRCHPDTTK